MASEAERPNEVGLVEVAYFLYTLKCMSDEEIDQTRQTVAMYLCKLRGRCEVDDFNERPHMNIERAIQQRRKRQRNRRITIRPLSSISDEKVPKGHDLELVDDFVGLPRGTTFKITVYHCDATVLNEKLREYEIQFDRDGMLPHEQRPKWGALMEQLGVGKQYWLDRQAQYEAMIEDMIEKCGEPDEMDELNIFN